jgi:glycosyltransferase involved in cell wall biosynthesis
LKILSITAGAAGMYCGSCFRDNALAAELMSRGHEVILLPLYTPTRTDEPNVSHHHIFFGGISVYFEQNWSLFRKTPRLLDRLWDSTALLKLISRVAIRTNPRQLGELTVSMLRGDKGYQHKEIRKLIDWLQGQPLPDVVNLPNSLLIGLARPLREALDRPVCCTLQGEDLFLEGLHPTYRDRALELIRANTTFVDVFTPVSHFYAEFMSSYLQVPDEKMAVVPLGINLEGYQPKNDYPNDTFTIGYFARVAPEKGLHLLCEAYRLVRGRTQSLKGQLRVAGYLGREHRPYLSEIKKKMEAWGLAGEFSYLGVVDRNEKIRFLQSLDVLSVPATYNEPKGMFLLESMANGTPVVQPRRGAFTEIIETTGGGLLVEPDNPEALAKAIRDLWNDRSLARELGLRGAIGVRRHYSVKRMADETLRVYEGLVG